MLKLWVNKERVLHEMFYRETTQYYKKLDELRQDMVVGVEKLNRPIVEDDKIKTMTKKQLKHLKKKLKKKKKKLKQKNMEIERQIIECENQMQIIENTKVNDQLNPSKSKPTEKSIEEQIETHQVDPKVISKPEITKSNVEIGSPVQLARAKSLPLYNRSPSTKRDRLKKNLIYLKKKLEDDLKVIKLHGIEELVG